MFSTKFHRTVTIALSAFVALTLSMLGVQVVQAQETPTTSNICSTSVATFNEHSQEKRQLLENTNSFQELAKQANTTASEIAQYLTLDQTESIAHMLSTAQPALKPWDFKCGKTWTGYLLYQAQGWLVCAPLAVATGGLTALVCNLIKTDIGSYIDFNKLCD